MTDQIHTAGGIGIKQHLVNVNLKRKKLIVNYEHLSICDNIRKA